MDIEEIYRQIEDGSMTVDKINDMDLSHLKGIDASHIDDRSAYYNTFQMALKISINSLYGALANAYFLLFNRDVAASITGNGRIFIQGLANYVNDKLKKMLGTNTNFVVYGDNDSVVGDTIIETEKFGKIKIENYYDYIDGSIEEKDPINFIKHIFDEDRTLSVTENGELRPNRINYVMKHQVKKRMFKITVNDSEVIVTEDHSVMVKREGKIIEVKPDEIKKDDFLITLNSPNILKEIEFTQDFVVEDLGDRLEWVYDIEVENDHNFFGNDICVHNSVYFTLDKLVEKLSATENPEILEKLISFDRKYLNIWVQEYIDIYSDTFNTFNKKPIGAKLEKIADKGMFVAKKKYALRAVWDEGSILLDNPKLAVTGLEIVRSSTPMFCRTHLKNMVNVILDNDAKTTISAISGIEDEFFEASFSDISRVSGIGTLEYEGRIGKYTRVNENGKTLTAPMNVRSAMNFNNFIDGKPELSKYPKIIDSDKIKYVFLKGRNPLGDDAIAYLDEDFLVDSGLDKYVDRERMWEDFFIAPLKIMLEAVGYELTQNFELDEWL